MSSLTSPPPPPPSTSTSSPSLITSTYTTTLQSPYFPTTPFMYEFKTLPPPPTPSGHTGVNTGLCTWSGCYSLCSLLPQMLDSLDDIVLRKGVCELGSGVGVTGAVITEYTRLRGVGDVVLTDGMDDVLELLKNNISNPIL